MPASRRPPTTTSTTRSSRFSNYAKREGLLPDNPALVLRGRKLGKTSIVIPSKAQFEKLIAKMRSLDVRFEDGANLVELLAYSRCDSET